MTATADDIWSHICGGCGGDPRICDHVWCPAHRIWTRDNGGRLVDCPGICPSATLTTGP